MIRSLLLTHPEVEFLWWMDSDSMFTDLAFELPWEQYAPFNLVMHGWNDMVYDDRNWIALNTDSFLLRNCQWSLDLLDAHPSSAMGPATSCDGADRRTHLRWSEPSLGREVALWMLDAVAEARGYNMRRVRANLYQIMAALSWVADVVRWAEDTRAWRNPSATILAHGVLLTSSWSITSLKH
ncbi:putative xyloglucan 6-xylosyltransferase 1 [Canna indica]|uniref:Xyloglucan 6-xylosyltransferase 1 n=1 Tax=Canna indica TaxID=4628 RepID=A0AAQ3KWB7_9LILI|nr:putative xyloglucan 6-xylosyltransferase 1 [Canna indica]